jgi:hypothetical protein
MKAWLRLAGLAASIPVLVGNPGFAADAPPAKPASTAAAINAGGY